MRKLLQNKAVVSGLAVVAVVCVAANFVKLPGVRFNTVNARASVPSVPAANEGQYHIHGPAFASLAAQPWRELYPIDPEARDPFAPMVLPTPVTVPVPKKAEPELPPTFTLQAISIDDERAFTVINQAVLREGESIAGYRVEKILSQQVRLSGPQGPIVLDLVHNVVAANPAIGKTSNADLPPAIEGPASGRSKP